MNAAAPDFSPLPAAPAMAERIGAILREIRARKPRIHAITSPVAQGLTANGLLALGAQPSLTLHLAELDDFIRSADAVLLNLGMLDPARYEALPRAAEACIDTGKPFVLDPVFAERSEKRRALARLLLGKAPAILKCNASEAAAFGDDIPEATVLVITGPTDHLRHRGRTANLHNGHPFLADVTATGCLLGAIIAACHAVETDPFVAALAGISLMNIAAEIAAEGAAGPGSFAVRLIDALAASGTETLAAQLKLESVA